MQRVAAREALDGGDLRAVLHHRESEARIDPPAIDQDRAGAALAVVAALLGPGEIEMQAQQVEQRRPRRDREFVLDAIDVQGNRHSRSAFPWFESYQAASASL